MQCEAECRLTIMELEVWRKSEQPLKYRTYDHMVQRLLISRIANTAQHIIFPILPVADASVTDEYAGEVCEFWRERQWKP
ncbi:MAG TPA: hypothetical protein VJK52_05090 [Candidatus Nanoarchaeia archaeon]|nr:hypothetical protein [Candidatus Nanoarchaeia archaeon]